MLVGALLVVAFADLPQGEDGASEDYGVAEASYADGDGYTYNEEMITNEAGETETIWTKTDEYGNTTTMNPEMITTYFPYQAVREHADGSASLRYYLSVEEGNTTIDAVIEYCDVENDKILVEQYVNAIPIDMSAYTINYEEFSEDANCGE